MEYHELLKACSEIKLEFSEEELKQIEEDTGNQASGSQFFFYHRTGRIGASISCKQVAHTDPAKPSQSLIKTICYPKILNSPHQQANMVASMRALHNETETC